MRIVYIFYLFSFCNISIYFTNELSVYSQGSLPLLLLFKKYIYLCNFNY